MTTVPTTLTAPATPDDAAQSSSIPVLRGQIDALDTAIARLVVERARVSRRIQHCRVAGGGARVELGRERVVRDGYRDALGVDGTQLADAVLRVCRGAH